MAGSALSEPKNLVMYFITISTIFMTSKNNIINNKI